AAAVLLDQAGKSLLLPPPRVCQKAAADDHVPSLVAKLWHFPTVPANGDGAAALQPLLRRELNIRYLKVLQYEPLAKGSHTVTYRRIEVAPYLIRVRKLPGRSANRVIDLNEVPE